MADLANELTRLFVLHKAGGLDDQQFATAKAVLLSVDSDSESDGGGGGTRRTRKGAREGSAIPFRGGYQFGDFTRTIFGSRRADEERRAEKEAAREAEWKAKRGQTVTVVAGTCQLRKDPDKNIFDGEVCEGDQLNWLKRQGDFVLVRARQSGDQYAEGWIRSKYVSVDRQGTFGLATEISAGSWFNLRRFPQRVWPSRGDHVVVGAQFMCNSSSSAMLHRGLDGTVNQVDEDGDLLIKFDLMNDKRWVKVRNFRHLLHLGKREQRTLSMKGNEPLKNNFTFEKDLTVSNAPERDGDTGEGPFWTRLTAARLKEAGYNVKHWRLMRINGKRVMDLEDIDSAKRAPQETPLVGVHVTVTKSFYIDDYWGNIDRSSGTSVLMPAGTVGTVRAVDEDDDEVDVLIDFHMAGRYHKVERVYQRNFGNIAFKYITLEFAKTHKQIVMEPGERRKAEQYAKKQRETPRKSNAYVRGRKSPRRQRRR